MSDCLKMSQQLQEGSILNTDNKSKCTMNLRRCSSRVCDIYTRVVHYFLVKLMAVLINLNVPNKWSLPEFILFGWIVFCVGTPFDEYHFKINIFLMLEEFEDK